MHKLNKSLKKTHSLKYQFFSRSADLIVLGMSISYRKNINCPGPGIISSFKKLMVPQPFNNLWHFFVVYISLLLLGKQIILRQLFFITQIFLKNFKCWGKQSYIFFNIIINWKHYLFWVVLIDFVLLFLSIIILTI